MNLNQMRRMWMQYNKLPLSHCITHNLSLPFQSKHQHFTKFLSHKTMWICWVCIFIALSFNELAVLLMGYFLDVKQVQCLGDPTGTNRESVSDGTIRRSWDCGQCTPYMKTYFGFFLSKWKFFDFKRFFESDGKNLTWPF